MLPYLLVFNFPPPPNLGFSGGRGLANFPAFSCATDVHSEEKERNLQPISARAIIVMFIAAKRLFRPNRFCHFHTSSRNTLYY
jgi:hypothetical protein